MPYPSSALIYTAEQYYGASRCVHTAWFPNCVSLLINADPEMLRRSPDSEASCGEELRRFFCLANARVHELIYSVSYDVCSAATAGLQPQVHLGEDLCWTVSAGLFLGKKKGELKPGIFVRKGVFFLFLFFLQNLQNRCTFVFYRKSIITSYFWSYCHG